MSESDSVADGEDHSLDPHVIPMQRIAGGLFTAAVALMALGGISIPLLVADNLPSWARILMLGGWFILATLAALFAYRWPAAHYRHTAYRVDDTGIEIRKGVLWRVVINVPKSRVQHIDVSQGPLERRYGLGKLVIYTAGTDHARVMLEGLEHGRVLRVREHLLPSGAGDAV